MDFAFNIKLKFRKIKICFDYLGYKGLKIIIFWLHKSCLIKNEKLSLQK